MAWVVLGVLVIVLVWCLVRWGPRNGKFPNGRSSGGGDVFVFFDGGDGGNGDCGGDGGGGCD